LEAINRKTAEDEAIVNVLANAAKDATDQTRSAQADFKRGSELLRRANILHKRAATNHLYAKVAEQEASETAPLRALLAETDDLAKKRRIQREIDGYRILNVQRPVPGLGNKLKTLPIANRALRRKMAHDVRHGMKHADLVGAYGRLALHVLEADAFNKALAGRHELGLSKDVQFAGTAALVAEDATEREAA
jgi:hypothetical protein